jgi:hypothetical protein
VSTPCGYRPDRAQADRPTTPSPAAGLIGIAPDFLLAFLDLGRLLKEQDRYG